MNGMLAGKRVRRRTISAQWPQLRSLHSWLLLSGLLALGSLIAVPLSALSQAAPAENGPAVHRTLRKKPVAAPVPEPAPPPQPTVAPSLFEQPAVPATVTARTNELTVKADNSSLTQILHQVSSATGMRLDGLGGDERVFGSFGPGAPREVLTALLNGTSYNVVMVGDLPNGAPRELLLSRRATGGSSPQPAAGANPNQTHNGDEDNPDDSGNSDDSSDDTPPPMQYSPPSIAPATPPGPETPGGAPQTPDAPQRVAPQMPVQNAPQ